MKPVTGWLVVERAWHECAGEWGFKILYQGSDEGAARDAAEQAVGRGARRVHLMRYTRERGARRFRADFTPDGLRASLFTSRDVRPGTPFVSRKRLRHMKRFERARGLSDGKGRLHRAGLMKAEVDVIE